MKNLFSALRSLGEHGTSTDMVTGLLNFFSIDIYASFYRGLTLSFITLLVAKKFDIFPNKFDKTFIVSTSLSESVVAIRLYRDYPIIISNRVSYVELV